MRVFFGVIIFYASFQIFGIEALLKSMAEPFHHLCLDRASHLGSLKHISSAVICGKRLSHSHPLKSSLINLGLIHLFVVSGAHLQFIRNWLPKDIKWTRSPQWIVLFGYVLLTGVGTPVLRAYLQLLTKQLLPKPLQVGPWICLWPGLLCLVILPTELFGFSLAMSWTCALIISQSGLSGWRQSLYLYLAMLPLLSMILIPHPGIILINTLALPAFSVMIFPALVVCMMVPGLSPLLAPVWQILELWLIETGTAVGGAKPILLEPPQFLPMGYCLLLHLGLQVAHISHLRAKN